MRLKFLKKGDHPPGYLADKVVNICLALVVFFLPLFFFPLSHDVLELNKMFFFSLITMIAFLVWLISSVLKKEIILRQGFLNTLIIIWGIVYLLAALFSTNRFISFLGNFLSSGSFLGLVFLILFYFLIVNTVRGIPKAWHLLRLFLLAGMLIVVFNLAQIFGVHILPFDFAQNNAFNLVANSVSIFVIYLVTLFIIGFGFLVKSTKRIDRIFIEIFLVLDFALLFFLDKKLGWYLMIAGLFFWLVFLSMQSKKLKSVWVIIPTILLVTVLALLFFSTASFTLLVPPTDLKLDYQTAFAITKSSLADSFLFGSGPEGFIYAFNTYRPSSFNDSPLWQLRFDRSYSEVFQLVATAGFFAVLLFIIISLWYLIHIGRNILSSGSIDDHWFFKAIVFSVFLVIFLSSFLNSFSTITSFIFWFLLGLGGLILCKKEKRLNLQQSTGANFGSSLIFSLLLIGAVSFLYFGIRIWLGDYYRAKSQRTFQETADLDQTQEDLIQGTNFSPWFASSHFWLADNLIARGAAALQTDNVATAQNFLTEAKSETERALLQDPKNAATYERAGEKYQVINSLGGAVTPEEILEAYKKAVELEPNNAILLQTLGSLYLAKARNLQATLGAAPETVEFQKELAETLNKAQEKFRKAIKLKDNYWKTEILLAQVLDLQGNRSQAIELLNNSLFKNPTNLTLLEESGKKLLSDNQLEDAQRRFQTILAQDPNHANAHFWLATIYEQEGEKDKAIEELELILKTNPNNSLVLQKLSELRGE